MWHARLDVITKFQLTEPFQLLKRVKYGIKLTKWGKIEDILLNGGKCGHKMANNRVKSECDM